MLFYLVAFIGGVISLFSPCGAGLLPLYLTMSFSHRKRILLSTLLFSLGVLTIFVPIGIGVSIFASVLLIYGQIVFKIAAILFFLFGIFIVFNIHPKNLLKSLGIDNNMMVKNTTYGSIFIMGAFSGFTLGICTGPIVGAIITLSSLTGDSFQSFALMMFYSAGIILPLFIIALGLSKLEFLYRTLVKGRLFKFHIFGRTIFIHSTNIFVAGMFFLLAYLFYFSGGRFPGFNFIIGLQDRLLELIY